MLRVKAFQAALLATALSGLVSPAGAAGRADAIGLGNLGTAASGIGFSSASALNGAGQVAGFSSYYVGGTPLGSRAFLWSNGTMTNLGSLGTAASGNGFSSASALNGAGQVAGWSSYYVGGSNRGERAFLWSNGTMTNLGSLGGSFSVASALNDSGQVVGYSNVAGNTAQHAFLYNAGTMFDLHAFLPRGWTSSGANAINAWAQVSGSGVHNGNNEAFLITLHPDWQGGNGYWDNPGTWNFGGLGAMGFTPGLPHDVSINPSGSATVTGSASALVNSLKVGGDNPGQIVTLNLNGGSISSIAYTHINSSGIVSGNGRLEGNVYVQPGGQIRVNSGEYMQITGGSLSNSGSINVRALNGTAALDVASFAQNFGQINLQNANVAFLGGLSNKGSINVTFGNSAVYGSITNYGAGRIVLSGRSNTTFYDSVEVQNGAELRVSAGSNAVFFGSVFQRTGSIFSGTGNSQYEGGLFVGGSPGFGSNAGNVTFGSGNLYLEDIGGINPCDAVSCIEGALTQNSSYTRYVVGGKLSFGGTLKLVSWNGFVAQAGQGFSIFGWGSTAGQFGSIDSSQLLLAPGTRLDTSRLYTDGVLSVTAVPELENYVLMLTGLCMIVIMVRRNRKAYPVSV